MRRALALAMTLALLALPAPALADGHPASDVLLVQDVYEPYQPKVPKPVIDALNATLKKARVAGFPLKVAIIATKDDLGSVPQFFGRPQPYSSFLEREIAFNQRVPLLTVMPAGYGSAEVPPGAAAALKTLKPPAAPAGGDAPSRA